VEITELPDQRCVEAVDLWRTAGLTRPWNDPEADLRRALDSCSSTVLAAVADDRLVATAMVGHDGHRGWIYYLAVVPERQRRGLGTAMVLACERWVAERGIPKVQLMVRAGNDGAVALYERIGYEQQEITLLGKRLGGATD
jgi:ribosomal protein S18 acetylase RimI-like enzyme